MSRLTYADLSKYLTPPDDPELEPYLAAAAVLDVFDPFALAPLDGRHMGGTPAEFLQRLLGRCEAITDGPERGHYRLTLPDRRAALERLAAARAMRGAPATDPRP